MERKKQRARKLSAFSFLKERNNKQTMRKANAKRFICPSARRLLFCASDMEFTFSALLRPFSRS